MRADKHLAIAFHALSPLSDARTPLADFFNSLLRFRYDMGIRLFDTVDRMDFRDHDVGERPLILDADEDENIRTAEAGVRLFHSGDAFQCADHILGPPCLYFDENVRSCCHVSLLVGFVVREA